MSRIDDEGREWEWCDECKRYRIVEDRSTEYAIEGAYMRRSTTEVAYAVTYFECGHQKSRRGDSTTYADPP